MGSDQSHHPQPSTAAAGQQGGSAGSGELMGGFGVSQSFEAGGGGGNISPPLSVGRQDSVCSDSEVPYVSYTVNKPIGGDSPKKSSATSYSSAASR